MNQFFPGRSNFASLPDFGDVGSRNGDPFVISFLYSKIAGEFTLLNFYFVDKIKHE